MLSLPANRSQVELLINVLAQAEGIPVGIALAQCQAESSFNQLAVSGCGAIGLFQLMPQTAEEMGIDPQRWHENVFGGLRYHGRLLRYYHGDQMKALAAYNWGMGHVDQAVKRLGAQWASALPEETKKYLGKILGKE